MRERLVPLTLSGSVVAVPLLSSSSAVTSARLARDLATSEEHAQDLFGRDPLSGLPNRLIFRERLDQELRALGRSGGGVAVLLLDLDRFKDVNDTYGHQAGDELIKHVARRLSERCAGPTRSPASAATSSPSSRPASAPPRMRGRPWRGASSNGSSQPFAIGVTPRPSIGVSIGIALAPENGDDRDDLMRLADTALYQAKSEGRNRYSFFERRMDEAHPQRKAVEEDLRQAITGTSSAPLPADLLGRRPDHRRARGPGALAACQAGPHQPGAASSPSPRSAASSFRSANGCCAAPATTASAGRPAHRRQRIADPVPPPGLRRQRHQDP